MPTRDVFIMVAPNGARRSKRDHPALPISARELAEAARDCKAAGAAAIHLHVRGADGSHTLDAGLYREATAAMREAAGDDFIIQITTEAVGRFTPQEQIACIRAVRPEAVSIALREIVPDRPAEAPAAELFSWMSEEGIVPQIILYEPKEVSVLLGLIDRGVVTADPFVLFVLGRYTVDQQSSPSDLDPFVETLGDGALRWAVCAFGRAEAACALHAATLGGHIRVGFENNFYLPDGTVARSNAELVAATARTLKDAGLGIMNPVTARRLLRCRAPAVG